MALPTNILQTVQTYQESELAYLLNLCCFVSTANTKFKDFEKMEANLGDTVTFDLPPRYVTNNSLVATFQASQQRVQTLTVDQAVNTSYTFTNQQFIFNVREYMDRFGKSAVVEIANNVEANIALNAISGVVNNNSQSPNFGLLDVYSGPFRFFGDGVTPINSFGQLASMNAAFRNFGAVKDKLKVYLSDIAVPQIANSGLNQFVMDRNEDIANSWMLGNWMGVEYYQSNLLPIQTAGNVGVNGTTLTVVSTNDPTGANVTQITFSGAGVSDPNAVFSGDLFQFQDNVSGKPNLRFLTFVGHIPCAQPIQFRAIANAGSTGGGNVTITLQVGQTGQGLCWQAGNPNQNVNTAIVAGMQVKALPSHRAGLIVGGNALFIAMPRLPDQAPFPTANESDPDTGVSLRLTYGTLFGQNQFGWIHDIAWGSALVPEYSMRIAFPLTQ